MAESYSVEAVLSAVDKNFTSTMERASAVTESFSSKAGKTLQSVGKVTTVVGAAIGAMAVSAIKSYGSFENSINQAAVVAGSSNKSLSGDMKSLQKVALSLGKTLPISAEEAGNAMVEMARNGASVKELKKEFPAIAKAAAVTGDDLSETAIAVQNAMNIWGGGAKNAAKDSAILALNANKSKVGIADMGQVFANVGSTAHTLGISVATLSAATGIMANSGLDAAQGSQDLNNAFTHMIKPTDSATGVMKKLGITYTDAKGNFKSFPAILKQVAAATDGMSQSQKLATLNTLYGTAGSKAMLPLLDATQKKGKSGKSVWDSYAGALEKVGNSSKNANKYLSENSQNMTKNVGQGIDQMMDSLDALIKTSISDIAPQINAITGAIENFASWLTTANTPIAEFTRKVIAMAPAIAVAVVAFGLLMSGVGKLMSSISAIGAVLTNPFALLVIAIVGVVAAVVIAYNKFAGFRTFVNSVISGITSAWQSFASWFGQLWSTLVSGAQSAWQGLVSFFSAIVSAIQTIWQGISTFFTTLWTNIVTTATTMWQSFVTSIMPIILAIENLWNALTAFFALLWTGIVSAATAIWDTLVLIFAPIIAAIQAAWQVLVAYFTGLWNTIVAITSSVWNSISAVISAAINIVMTVISTVLSIISALWSAVWNAIKAVASAVWNSIVAVVSAAINIVANVIKGVTAFIKGDWSGVWNAIKSITSSVWSAINSVISNAIQAAKAVITSVLNAIKSVFSSVWNAIKSITSSVWNAIKAVVTFAINGVKGVVSSGLNTVRSVVSSVLNGIKSVFSSAWNSLKSIVSNAFSGVVSAVRGGMQRAYSAVTGFAGRMASAGHDFVNGFVRGITGAIGSAASAAANMAKKALGAAKSALGIHSPSRVMRDQVGKYVPLGMAVGIEKNIKAVSDAARLASNAAVVSVPAVNTTDFTRSLRTLNSSFKTSGSLNRKLSINEGTTQLENNRLLKQLVGKSTDVYLDGDVLVGGTVDRYNNALGSKFTNESRWSRG